MSDQPLSPDHELASAYVDGLASAPERAQVEASPELMAVVAEFRAQRAALAAVPPVDDGIRTAAFAAALAEFDALAAAPAATPPQVAALAATGAAAPPAPPPNVVPLHRQRRWSRGLGVAAAVALIGLVGVAVSNLSTGGSSQDSSSAGTEMSAGDANTLTGTDSSKVGIASNATDPTGGQAPVVNGSDTTAGSPGTIDSINGGGSAVPAYSDTQSLKALPEPTSRVSPSFVLQCSLDTDHEILLEITWKGTPAVVVRDTVTGEIAVLDAQCNTLVSVDN